MEKKTHLHGLETEPVFVFLEKAEGFAVLVFTIHVFKFIYLDLDPVLTVNTLCLFPTFPK